MVAWRVREGGQASRARRRPDLGTENPRVGGSIPPLGTNIRASRRRADLAEDVELLERLARADHDRAERVLGEEHRQARLLAEQRIKALQERAAAREHDAAVGDVAGEFGGRALERALHHLDDGVDRLGQRVADLVAVLSPVSVQQDLVPRVPRTRLGPAENGLPCGPSSGYGPEPVNDNETP